MVHRGEAPDRHGGAATGGSQTLPLGPDVRNGLSNLDWTVGSREIARAEHAAVVPVRGRRGWTVQRRVAATARGGPRYYPLSPSTRVSAGRPRVAPRAWSFRGAEVLGYRTGACWATPCTGDQVRQAPTQPRTSDCSCRRSGDSPRASGGERAPPCGVESGALVEGFGMLLVLEVIPIDRSDRVHCSAPRHGLDRCADVTECESVGSVRW